jgi:NADH-quinone oxidoreductase subunit J
VGAVMVLFLFVVMMMDINVENLRDGFWTHFPLIALIGVVIALEMSAVLMGGFRVAAPMPDLAADVPNTLQLGRLLYSEYLYPVEIAAAILLVAMIAAIALTLRARKDSKYVSPGEQVRVRAADRLTVLKMDASQVDAAPEESPPYDAASADPTPGTKP